MRSRAAVNEIEEFQTLEDLPDAVTVVGKGGFWDN